MHLHFCKNVLGVRLQTQNAFIYGELGRSTLTNHNKLQMIKYWFKILKSNDTRYIKNIYNIMLRDLDNRPGKNNWAKSIKLYFGKFRFYSCLA